MAPTNLHLRESGSPWFKSAYAAEANPWVEQEEMEAALLLRGAILNAYGLIETRLAEIALRCSVHDAYRGVRKDFPYGMPSRIAYLRQVFSSGPLAPFGGIADAFLTRFEATTELRHMMAHAYMETCGDLVGWGATFHDYQPGKGGAIRQRSRRMRLAEMETEAASAARLSRRGRKLHWHLCESGILPELR